MCQVKDVVGFVFEYIITACNLRAPPGRKGLLEVVNKYMHICSPANKVPSQLQANI